MALQIVTLETAAKIFRVHPRTILRAIERDHNIYWTEDSNQDTIKIVDIARAYGIAPKALIAVFEGRDALLRADEAAEVLGMATRTFRKHLDDKATKWGRVSYGRITRYLQTRINSAVVAAME